MKSKILLLTLTSALSIQINAQWNPVSTPITGKLQSVVFTSATNGFTAGAFQYMYATTNGGSTWNSVGNYSAMDIHFFDATNGYAASVAGSGTMKRTTDGGVTWPTLTPPNSSSIWGTFATSSTTCYFISTDAKVHKSTNGGGSFTSVNISTSLSLTDIWFTDANTGYLTGQDGKIFKTTNAGTTWTLNYTASGVQLNGVHFVNQNLGFACGTNGTVLRTIDAGGSWSTLTTGTTTILSGIRFFDALNGIAVGYGGTIIRTIDGGNTWVTDPSNTTKWLYSISYTGAGSSAVIVGDSGIVLKNTNIQVGINQMLFQPMTSLNCYPSPANDVVNIVVCSSVNTSANTELLDVNGKTVKCFTVSALAPGENNMILSVTDLAPGIYFVRMSTGEGTVQKRIVVAH